MPEEAEAQKPNVIDISKFFGGKTLASADLKVGTQTIKAEPSFIAAAELAKMLDVISTYTEVNKTQKEEITSIERIREREIVERNRNDDRFYQALTSLNFDIETLKNSFSSIVQTLQNDKKLREQEIRDERDKQKAFESEAREAQKGLQFQQTTATASESFSGQIMQSAEEKPKSGLSLAAILGTAGAAALLGTGEGTGDGTGEGDTGGASSGSVPGGNFDAEKLTSLARSVGMPEDKIPTMVAIALGESGGGSGQLNNNRKTNDLSYGLWQINMIDDLGPERRKQFGIKSNEELFDPVTNAKAAKIVLQRQGLSAWSVYKEGIHKQYLPQAEKAYRKSQSSAKPAAAPATSSKSDQISSSKKQEDGQRAAPQIAAVPIPRGIEGQITPPPTEGPSVVVTQSPQTATNPSRGKNVSPMADLELFASTNSEDINVLSSMYQLNIA